MILANRRPILPGTCQCCGLRIAGSLGGCAVGAWYDRITARARGVSAAWRKLPRKHCSGNTHSAAFKDLPTAEAACAKMGGACGGVYDNGCRFGSSNASRSVQIYLCKGGAALSTSSSSCVYTASTPPAGAHQDQLRGPGPRAQGQQAFKQITWRKMEIQLKRSGIATIHGNSKSFLPISMEYFPQCGVHMNEVYPTGMKYMKEVPWNIYYFIPVGSQEGEIPLARARIWYLESAPVQSFELQVLFQPWVQRASPSTVCYGQGAPPLWRLLR